MKKSKIAWGAFGVLAIALAGAVMINGFSIPAIAGEGCCSSKPSATEAAKPAGDVKSGECPYTKSAADGKSCGMTPAAMVPASVKEASKKLADANRAVALAVENGESERDVNKLIAKAEAAYGEYHKKVAAAYRDHSKNVKLAGDAKLSYAGFAGAMCAEVGACPAASGCCDTSPDSDSAVPSVERASLN